MYTNQFFNPRPSRRLQLYACLLLIGLTWSVVWGVPSTTSTTESRSSPNTQRAHKPEKKWPQWAQGLIWYQVFPERFSNGNPLNDPQQTQSTTVDWDQPFDEPTIEEIERSWMLAAGQPRLRRYNPNAPGGSISNVIYNRRYGGDLQGVLEHLDDLKALGVGGIYLCPIFTSTSLHKYDAADHRHIDPTLADPGNPFAGIPAEMIYGDPSDESTWGWTDADRWFIDVFIPAVHDRGLRLMLDGVWNHVGVDHWMFRDVMERGSESPFADWFECSFDENGALVGWKSWGGRNGRLPVFRQMKDGDLAPGPKAHMMAVTRRWMDPNGDGDPSDGIDGWRLDVANEIGRPFWKDWRTLVKGINPEALIVGEIWFDAKEYFDGTAFDAQMNYPAAYAVADWLSIGHMKGDAQSLADRLREVYSHNLDTDLMQLNLMSSHDTERLASLMENDHIRSFDNGAHPWRNTTYNRQTVSDDALVRSLVAYMVMVANPGSLMIYNGDEFGMVGADDPDDRRPIPRELFRNSEIDNRSRWFRDEVRWINMLLQDPDIGPILRFGDADWNPSHGGGGIRIRRRYGNRSLVVDIGPCGEDWGEWGGWGGSLSPEPASSSQHLFERGDACWEIRLSLIGS